MNIIFISPRFHTNHYETTKALLNSGHKLKYFVTHKGKIENYKYIKPILLKESILTKFINKIVKTKHKNILFVPNIFFFLKEVRKFKPNIIICRLYGRLLPYFVMIIAKLFKIKLIINEQAGNNLNYLKKKTIISIIKKIDFWFRHSLLKFHWATPLKVKKSFDKNCFYLPFVVKVNNKLKKQPKKLNFLIISKFFPRKNILLAIKVIKNLLNKYNFNVTIIGELSNEENRIYYNKVVEYVASNNINKNVKIIKNVKHKNIFKYYLSHHIFVLPAHNEPASISILEALGFGLPVICSNTCGTSCYLKNNFSKIFTSNSYSSLKEKIEYFIKNKKNYSDYSKNAVRYAKLNLSKKNYIKYFNYYLKNS